MTLFLELGCDHTVRFIFFRYHYEPKDHLSLIDFESVVLVRKKYAWPNDEYAAIDIEPFTARGSV